MRLAEPLRDAHVSSIARADRRRGGERFWPVVVVAGAVFAIAYENGASGTRSRAIVAIVLCWAMVLAVGLGQASRFRFARPAATTGALFAAFVAWTLASSAWAPDAAAAFDEFNRNALYLGAYVVVAALASTTGLRQWVEGLRLGIVAVVVVALVSRLSAGSFGRDGITDQLPSAAARLSFPIGYWNGLAVLAALALPPSLAVALDTTSTVRRRALAVAGVPLVVAVVVLASSRGGALALAVGLGVFLIGSGQRWSAVRVAAVAAVGAAVALLVLRGHPSVVDGPFSTAAARYEGRWVAVWLVVISIGTGGLLLLSERVSRRVPSPPRAVGIGVLAMCAAALAVAIALGDPVRRLDAFRQVPTEAAVSSSPTAAHLASVNGSGRWQFWAAAVDEWKSAPLAGGGAASFRFWWSAHASFTYYLKNAHSLYLEVLAELGVVGLVLLTGAVARSLIAGAARLRTESGHARECRAALVALDVAFFVSAGVDWLWQIPALAIVGMAALAACTSPAARPDAERGSQSPARFVVGAVGLAAWAVMIAQAIPWLAAARVADSQAAAARGDLQSAQSAAEDARAIEPWSAKAYVQLALVAEARDDRPSAVAWIREALRHSPYDWSIWYVASRMERKAGNDATASRAYRRARELNVRSPVFATGPP